MKVCLLLFMILFASKSYGTTRVYEAMVSYKGELVFIEKHADTYVDGRIQRSLIKYFDPSGVQVGSYQSDFGGNPYVPEHLLEDTRTNLKHGLSYKNKEVQVFWEEGGKVTKERAMKSNLFEDKSTFTTQGLHYFILRNLKDPDKLNNKKVSLVVPGSLNTYDYLLKVLFETSRKVEIELKRDNWFLSFLSPRMKFIYDRENDRLLAYEGVYSLKENAGEPINVDVSYKYPKNPSF